MILSIIWILGLSVLVYLFYKYTKLQIQLRKTNTKGPGVFFWTNGLRKNGLSHPFTEWVHKNNITDFAHLMFGPYLTVRAVDADAAKFILSSHKDEFMKSFAAQSPNYQKKWFVENLVGTDGSDWRRQRTIFNPAFNHKAYHSYYPIFLEKIEKVIANFAENDSKDIDLDPYLHKLTIDILGSSIFTYDFGTLDNKNDEYYEAYKLIMENNFSFLTLFFPFLEYAGIPRIERHKKAYLKLEELFSKMISERKHESKNGNDVLDRLLYSEKFSEKNNSEIAENVNSEKIPQHGMAHLSKNEVYSNLFIFFIAGHETTASALSWAVLELAKHPEEQQKLYDEISATIGDKIPTFEDLDKIPYLDQFVSETLRLHPPVPQLGTRRAVRDITYQTTDGKNIFISKGTISAIDILSIHTSPKYWKNPSEFNPSRFSSENKKGYHKFQYIPFSHGPRECIGAKFSIIEQHIFLIRLLQKYCVEKPHQEPFSEEHTGFLNKPLKSVVRLIPRK